MMHRIRKYFTLAIIAVFAVLIIATLIPDGSLSNDYVRITALDYKAVIADEPGSRGKAIITERLTFDAYAASKNDLFWELWRDLPEEYVDGVKVEYKVNSVKQILPDGTAKAFAETPNLYWWDGDYISAMPGYGPGKWHHSKGPYDGERNFECVLFYVDGLYRETVVFEIEYEMYNASLRYEDCAEFYISLYSGDAVEYLRSLRGQILFPDVLMPGAGNYRAYTYGTNSDAFPFTESSSANPGYRTFSFILDEAALKFRPYNRYIEFALISFGADKHKFTQFAEANYYYNVNMLSKLNMAQAEYDALPGRFLVYKSLALFLGLLAALAIIAAAATSGKRLRRKYSFFRPAQDFKLYRDIPFELDPCFARDLVFCRHSAPGGIRDGYAAVMLSLAKKGYIDLDRINGSRDWKPSNVKIVIKHIPIPPQMALNEQPGQPAAPQAISPLSPTEMLYFDLILRHANGGEISLSRLQSSLTNDYDYTNAFANNTGERIKSIGMSLGYLQESSYKKLKKSANTKFVALCVVAIAAMLIGNLVSYQYRLSLAFGAYFVLGAGMLASALIYKVSSKRYLLLTQLGEDEYSKWRGLYNFLNSETLLKERTVLELALWEHYLIYATAFGISKKVLKALSIRCPEAYMSPVLRNPYFRSRRFYVSSRSFGSSVRSASFSARSGGWGGHGGGGRGGGGGGGGH